MPEWLLPVLALAFTVITFSAGLGWKQANQFSLMKSSIYDRLEKVEGNILNKLEYHERHDDVRFSDLKNDIWMLRLRAAANSSLLTDEEERVNVPRQERGNQSSR